MRARKGVLKKRADATASASTDQQRCTASVQTRLTPSPTSRAGKAVGDGLRARNAILTDFFDPDCIAVAGDAQRSPAAKQRRKQMNAGRARAPKPSLGPSPMPPVPEDAPVNTAFCEADLRLFQEGKHADATIVASGKAFRIHKNIVLARCPYLRRSFKNVFNNGECDDDCLMLSWSPDVLEIGLTFIYAGNLPEPLAALHRDSFRAQVNLWYLGCVLEMPSMSALAMAYMYNLCATLLRGIIACSADHAEDGGSSQQRRNSLATSAADVTDLTEAIRGAYSFDVHPQPPNELTDALVDFVFAGRDLFFPDNAACNALLEDTPLFGAHLCQRLLGLRTSRWATARNSDPPSACATSPV